MTQILIAGVAGFVGAHLAHHLKSRYETAIREFKAHRHEFLPKD